MKRYTAISDSVLRHMGRPVRSVSSMIRRRDEMQFGGEFSPLDAMWSGAIPLPEKFAFDEYLESLDAETQDSVRRSSLYRFADFGWESSFAPSHATFVALATQYDQRLFNPSFGFCLHQTRNVSIVKVRKATQGRPLLQRQGDDTLSLLDISMMRSGAAESLSLDYTVGSIARALMFDPAILFDEPIHRTAMHLKELSDETSAILWAVAVAKALKGKERRGGTIPMQTIINFVNDARPAMETFTPEEAFHYVSRGLTDIEVIRAAIDAGIHPDMIASISINS